jgi:hypothetical protein
MHSVVEVVDPFLQTLPISVPRHSIETGNSRAFELEVAVLEHFRGDVVQ